MHDDKQWLKMIFIRLHTSFDRNYNLLKYSRYNDMKIDVFYQLTGEHIQQPKCLMM